MSTRETPRSHRSVERYEIDMVEGIPLAAPAVVRVLAETDAMLLVEVSMPAGGASPPHVHGHDSVGYIVTGKVRMTVADETESLGPGDGFHHPPGAEHSIEAVDGPAIWIEVKSPPVRTW